MIESAEKPESVSVLASNKKFTSACEQFMSTLCNGEPSNGKLTNSQRAAIAATTLYESYRTIISSYLIVFVPQNCGGYSCTIIQNLLPADELEISAISINSFMAFYFCALFYIEQKRETIINQYLVYDRKSPTDKEYLSSMILLMEETARDDILKWNRRYRFCAQSILFMFFVNVGISCLVVYKNFLNNTTAIVFITNALFMINRIYRALKIGSAGEYNIYSAYRAESILFNRDRSSWLNQETAELRQGADSFTKSFWTKSGSFEYFDDDDDDDDDDDGGEDIV